jgi:hypothetical protein
VQFFTAGIQMSLHIEFDRSTYLIGLCASAVYIFVLGYLATREYLCNSVAGLNCPQSPFNSLHIVLHSGFLLYLLMHATKISKSLLWKWCLLCAVALVFIVITVWQILSDPATIAVYAALLSSIICYFVFLLDTRANDNLVKLTKVGLTGLVLLACVILLKILNII